MTEQPRFCEAHIAFAEKISAIFTTVVNIEKGLTEDSGFKRGVFISFLGFGVLFIVNIASFSFLFGELNRQSAITSSRVAIIEDIEREAQTIRASNVARLKGIEDRLNSAEEIHRKLDGNTPR
jgi:hypothetical protein